MIVSKQITFEELAELADTYGVMLTSQLIKLWWPEAKSYTRWPGVYVVYSNSHGVARL